MWNEKIKALFWANCNNITHYIGGGYKMEVCRMVAIDSSTKKTALAVFDNGNYKTVHLIDCSNLNDMNDRFASMAKLIFDFLEKNKPYIIYMEETVVERNASTQRFLTRLQGIVYAYCMKNDCEFNTIRPTEWRKLVGIEQGKKEREILKKEAIDLVLKEFGITVTDDEAESILIGLAIIKKFEKM